MFLEQQSSLRVEQQIRAGELEMKPKRKEGGGLMEPF